MYSLTDPLQIQLNYTVLGTAVELTFADLDLALHSTLFEAVVQGVAIGGGVLLMLASWFVIINKRTPIFAMNQLTLFLLVVRSSLYLGYLFGPLNGYSYSGTGLFYDYWSAYRVTVATNVFYVMLIAAIQITLVYQIYVVFHNTFRKLQLAVTAFTSALATSVVCLYIYTSTVYLREVRELFAGQYEEYELWITYVPFILFSASLNIMSLVLIVKLYFAVRTRRKLGLTQFDSFHILLIMTTQTGIVPSIMMIYQYAGIQTTSTAFSNLSVVIAVCNLPLSSLWASSANNTAVPVLCQNSVLTKHSSRDSQDTLAHSQVSRVKLGFKDMESAHSDFDTESIDRIMEQLEQPGVEQRTTIAFKEY